MIEQIKIARVWHISNNELKCSNKKVSISTYNNVEIATLKEERNYDIQEFLIKDENNEYWSLGIAPIRLNLFIGDSNSYLTEKEKIEKYRQDITEAYKNIDLKAFWMKKINENRYFNKCELEYIHRFYPDIYEQAKKSRENFLENKNNEKEKERLEGKEITGIRISTESEELGIYKSFNYEIFERRKSIVLAFDGNSPVSNLVQEAKNGKGKSKIYVNKGNEVLSEKMNYVEGYVTPFSLEENIIEKIIEDNEEL